MKNRKAALLAATLMLTTLSALAEAKYVFYFIGDGMGLGHVNTTQTYIRDVLHGEPLLMTTFPVATQATTYSANSPITDSAAAGTALSTGRKTLNDRVAMGLDSVNFTGLAADFLAAGYAAGVGTSVAGDDATPAAFYAHALGRGDKENIAPWAIESGLSFLGGGNFKIMGSPKGEEWLADMQSKGGYTLVRTLDDYNALVDSANQTRGNGKKKNGGQTEDGKTAGKILFIPRLNVFDQLGYTVDSIPGATPLRELTEVAIGTLASENPERFFLMIEGGNIDWAAHANDGAAVIKEIINFQESISQAYDFYLAHPEETLIVVTADHDTGGMAIGREDNRKNPHLELVDRQRMAKDTFNQWLERKHKEGHRFTWPEMETLLREKLSFWEGIPLTDAETEELKESFNATFVEGTAEATQTWYQKYNRFAVDVYNIANRHYGIGWTSSSHTANMVPVYVIGEGRELFGRQLDNTEIPLLIKKAAGLAE